MKLILPKRPSWYNPIKRLRWNKLYKLSRMLWLIQFEINSQKEITYPICKKGKKE